MTIDSAITEHNVNALGIHGKLFRASDHEVRPGIIVIGGSGGDFGWSDGMAYKLASEGYAALALAYFRYANLPKALINIPLEYFETAFAWMADRKDIDTRKLALIGGSRGAELALILGSTIPRVKVVVGYAPSSVIWGACGGFSSIGKAAWTYGCQPLPTMKIRISLSVLKEYIKMLLCLISRRPFQNSLLFITALRSQSSVNRSCIQVEKINGPVLLISGDDDQLFPSTLMSEMIIDRLKKLRHPFPYKHLRYEGAGHAINLPDLPLEAYPTKITHSLTGIVYDLGGNPDINAQAAKSAWTEMIAFLNAHVKH